jgi:hypothetical protein
VQPTTQGTTRSGLYSGGRDDNAAPSLHALPDVEHRPCGFCVRVRRRCSLLEDRGRGPIRLRSLQARSFFLVRPTGFEPVTYGSGERTAENAERDHAETSGETLYLAAGETPVPALSRLREDLDRPVKAGNWLRVAELAARLAAWSRGDAP